MKISRFSVLCLGSLWFAACATAQDGASPGDSDDSSGGSGAVSSGGAIGSSGTNGAFGGAAGIPGSGGSISAGTSGTDGGASGSTAGGGTAGGAGGSAGTGGGGGSAPVFAAGVCAANPTMSLSYKQSNTTAQVDAQYQFSNLTTTPIPLAQLKIRYFFTNEETTGWSTHIYSAQVDGPTFRNIASGTTLTIVKLAAPLTGADSYVEIAFSDASSLANTDTGSVSWELQPLVYDPPPAQVQANDYSFNAADTTFTPWDHIAVYQGDTLVYGCVPKSLDDGSGGAGGDTGAAGAVGAAGAD
jgi:Cellulose binding domain